MVVYVFYTFLALPFLIWIGVGAWHALVERRRWRRDEVRFQSHVGPEFLRNQAAHLEQHVLKPTLQDVTVLLTNVTDSVGLYERVGDVSGAKIINRYYAVITPAVRRNGGIISKFLGDGIMATFGVPSPDCDHAAEAVTAVLDIQEAIDALNAELVNEGGTPLVVRIGVASGLALVGDAGTTSAADYIVHGDIVNVAGRLERLNKKTGTRNLISDVTVARLNGRFRFRPVEPAAEALGPAAAGRLFEVVPQSAEAVAR